MPRYKAQSTNGLFVAVVLEEQLLPGTFEFALNHLVDDALDLSALDEGFHNDEMGASAYDPRVLLKIVLLAYSRGLISSRSIARACEQNVQFMAISGDSRPSYTQIAKFVRTLEPVIQPLFTQVLMVCDAQGLIGKQMFAIDGVKLPGNASKESSGTHAELAHRAQRLDKAAAKILARHVEQDQGKAEQPMDAKAQAQREKLHKEAQRMRDFIASNAPKTNAKGQELKSNVTDPDSAKMATSKGVIQGYAAQAAVDNQSQVIVAAAVMGTSSEHAALLPMIQKTDVVREAHTLITADAGYHSKDNLKALQEQNIPALIADNQMRQRDEAFAERGKYKQGPDPLHNKAASSDGQVLYAVSEFTLSKDKKSAYCPQGKRMYSGGQRQVGKTIYLHFKGSFGNCEPCQYRGKCLRTPDTSRVRTVAIAVGEGEPPQDAKQCMREAIDSAQGRRLYSQRIGTVEPVFGNIRHNKRMNRFTLRGQAKVNTQWNMYCLVHNIEKLSHTRA